MKTILTALALVAGTPVWALTTIQNVRIVVDHDQTVRSSGGSVGDCNGNVSLWLSGYLVSVDSPSLAP